MSPSACECSTSSSSVLETFPDKRAALDAYIDALDLKVDMRTRRGYLIHCLHEAQGLFGYLPLEVQCLVAERLRLQQADIYGVISFYSYFTDKPVGRNKVSVCTGTACFVRGAEKILDKCKDHLGVEEGDTTPDMRVTLNSLRCIGACSLAPAVMVNDKVHALMTPQKIPGILDECK